jgi:outer membrane lipoprotein SlyB
MHSTRKSQAWGHARRLVLAGLMALLAAGSGCETAAGTGALGGSALGAGIGALASHGCPGAALAGAAIGAGAGAIGGAVVDGARDRRAQRAAAADVALRAPSLDEVVRMTQAAVPPAQIVNQVQTSGVVYRLTPEQVIWLNQQGVHASVVQAMQATAYRGGRAYTPVVVEQPVYVAPPPVVPVGVGLGLNFGR